MFPGGTQVERKRLQSLPRVTIGELINKYKLAIEARAVDSFWLSRKKGQLRRRPEKIAQSHFALFTKGVLDGRAGIVLREFSSGIGVVDIGVIFYSTLHLVEMKILKAKFTGAEQLEQYMRTEGRNEGHLLVIDTLKPSSKFELPARFESSSGTIKVYRVDVNPIPPSSLS